MLRAFIVINIFFFLLPLFTFGGRSSLKHFNSIFRRLTTFMPLSPFNSFDTRISARTKNYLSLFRVNVLSMRLYHSWNRLFFCCGCRKKIHASIIKNVESIGKQRLIICQNEVHKSQIRRIRNTIMNIIFSLDEIQVVYLNFCCNESSGGGEERVLRFYF